MEHAYAIVLITLEWSVGGEDRRLCDLEPHFPLPGADDNLMIERVLHTFKIFTNTSVSPSKHYYVLD